MTTFKGIFQAGVPPNTDFPSRPRCTDCGRPADAQLGEGFYCAVCCDISNGMPWQEAIEGAPDPSTESSQESPRECVSPG